MTPEGGASLITKYSGKIPAPTRSPDQRHGKSMPGRIGNLRSDSKNTSESSFPGRPPARSNQRNLETLFQDVSEGIQRRTEAWSVAKAVRGAMAEARRNIQSIQSDAAPPTSRSWDIPRFGSVSPSQANVSNAVDLKKKIELLEDRNKTLAKILGEALKDLRSLREVSKNDHNARSNEALNHALARIESVQTCLDTSSMPVVSAEGSRDTDSQSTRERAMASKQGDMQGKETHTAEVQATTNVAARTSISVSSQNELASSAAQPAKPTPRRPATRPSLAESGFSWMLGDNRYRSSFVSSVSVPPEQSRQGDAKEKQNPLFGDGREEGRGKPAIEDDGLLLKSLRGTNDRR